MQKLPFLMSCDEAIPGSRGRDCFFVSRRLGQLSRDDFTTGPQAVPKEEDLSSQGVSLRDRKNWRSS